MISKLLKKNEKGFTLMEMLIVVAIIAVLVAIAIPTFNSSLNKAKVATDQANIRAGYAAVMVKGLLDEQPTDNGNLKNTETFYLQKDGSVTTTETNNYLTQGKPDADVEIGGINVTKWETGKKVAYTYDYSTNKITITLS